jgi:hypothetical protein
LPSFSFFSTILLPRNNFLRICLQSINFHRPNCDNEEALDPEPHQHLSELTNKTNKYRLNHPTLPDTSKEVAAHTPPLQIYKQKSEQRLQWLIINQDSPPGQRATVRMLRRT